MTREQQAANLRRRIEEGKRAERDRSPLFRKLDLEINGVELRHRDGQRSKVSPLMAAALVARGEAERIGGGEVHVGLAEEIRASANPWRRIECRNV